MKKSVLLLGNLLLSSTLFWGVPSIEAEEMISIQPDWSWRELEAGDRIRSKILLLLIIHDGERGELFEYGAA